MSDLIRHPTTADRSYARMSDQRVGAQVQPATKCNSRRGCTLAPDTSGVQRRRPHPGRRSDGERRRRSGATSRPDAHCPVLHSPTRMDERSEQACISRQQHTHPASSDRQRAAPLRVDARALRSGGHKNKNTRQRRNPHHRCGPAAHHLYSHIHVFPFESTLLRAPAPISC